MIGDLKQAFFEATIIALKNLHNIFFITTDDLHIWLSSSKHSYLIKRNLLRKVLKRASFINIKSFTW